MGELHAARNGNWGWRTGLEHEVNVEFIKLETLVGMDPDGSQSRFWAGR